MAKDLDIVGTWTKQTFVYRSVYEFEDGGRFRYELIPTFPVLGSLTRLVMGTKGCFEGQWSIDGDRLVTSLPQRTVSMAITRFDADALELRDDQGQVHVLSRQNHAG